jgi:PPOX class probable F420-dependent enzyme
MAGEGLWKGEAMARPIARNETVDRAGLEAFLRGRRRLILMTTRSDGRPQLSPTTFATDGCGRISIATYPSRAKVANARRTPAVSACVLSDEWNGPWVQVDGTAEVLDLPDALEPLVEYFRCASGEHPDWDEYRQAMLDQGKCLIRIQLDSWGPLATGGFPPELAAT